MNNSWIERKKTKPIFVGSVGIGGDHPISIQSMTNTNTEDIKATVNQIEELDCFPQINYPYLILLILKYNYAY